MPRRVACSLLLLWLLFVALIACACGRERPSFATLPTSPPPAAKATATWSPWGKFDEGLYKALQLAQSGTLLPVTISVNDPWGYDSIQVVNTELQLKYGALYNKWRSGEPMNEHQREVLEARWQERFAELDYAASQPLRNALDALGIEYTWRDRARSVDAWLTQQQVAEVARLDAVADLRYVGYPDPNYVAPTPTALPQGWIDVPFARVMATDLGGTSDPYIKAPLLLTDTQGALSYLGNDWNVEMRALTQTNFAESLLEAVRYLM